MKNLKLLFLVCSLGFALQPLYSQDYYLAEEIDPILEQLEENSKKQEEILKRQEETIRNLQQELKNSADSLRKSAQRNIKDNIVIGLIAGGVSLAAGITIGVNLQRK